MTTFYCLRFETPPTWRARSLYLYPPGTVWPSYTPRHWVPFSSPPTTCSARVGIFEPTSTRASTVLALVVLLRTPVYGPSRKHRFQQYGYCYMRIRCRGKVFTEPLPRNGSGIFAYRAIVA
jgi:hypothetical protein